MTVNLARVGRILWNARRYLSGKKKFGGAGAAVLRERKKPVAQSLHPGGATHGLVESASPCPPNPGVRRDRGAHGLVESMTAKEVEAAADRDAASGEPLPTFREA